LQNPAAARSPPELVVAIRGPMRPDHLRRLCEALRAALEMRPAVVLVCEVSSVARLDLSVVDALARLALTARRCGRSLVVRRACPELRELLSLVGLASVPGFGFEPGREPEEREPPGRVEEERDPGDAVP
jgi:ABC-type transporter Mla MlaB component